MADSDAIRLTGVDFLSGEFAEDLSSITRAESIRRIVGFTFVVGTVMAACPDKPEKKDGGTSAGIGGGAGGGCPKQTEPGDPSCPNAQSVHTC